jgi:hypothetical protein
MRKKRPIPLGVDPTPEQATSDSSKALRNARLLSADDNQDLYSVALDSEEASLTPLRRYFLTPAHEEKP